ncbi:MAG: ATP-binding cassette domain-containing protein, partial [Planctomycetota bacterium]
MSSGTGIAAEGTIRVSDLAIGYGGKALMEDLNFEVPQGSIFSILGGSGTGKSTLLRHMIGLQEPLAGTVRLPDGEPPVLGGRPKFGAMFQSGALFGSMNLLDNVALPLRRWTDIEDSAIIEIAKGRLRLVSLGGFEHHFPNEISGGMKKRAGIARALALDPSLLFLDEPSAGLDPVSAVELDDLLLTLRDSSGVTTVIVTHE